MPHGHCVIKSLPVQYFPLMTDSQLTTRLDGVTVSTPSDINERIGISLAFYWVFNVDFLKKGEPDIEHLA